mmetsp:Transcript_101803/g.287166  ORF Transcript_101803/g.287166 Transcript_101803/m.287166 type:complete len:1029 (+) Transcript_101803:173-3259(+)
MSVAVCAPVPGVIVPSPTASTCAPSRFSSSDSSPAVSVHGAGYQSLYAVGPTLTNSASCRHLMGHAAAPHYGGGCSVVLQPAPEPHPQAWQAAIPNVAGGCSVVAQPAPAAQAYPGTWQFAETAAAAGCSVVMQAAPGDPFAGTAPAPYFGLDGGLEGIIAPGDVLYVRGRAGFFELGTAGGTLGHVMLAIGTPERIECSTDEGLYLEHAWPPGGVTEIWKVRTAESTRNNTGLHEAEQLLYIAPDTRKLTLIAELGQGEFFPCGECAELWQSPDELRAKLHGLLVAEVLGEMRMHGADWSWSTALRAVLSSEDHFKNCEDKTRILQDIKDSWAMDPICTSVVIGFWQRCLCKLAEATSGSAAAGADLILQWLPLKADRSLPGTLLGTMQRCGWKRRTTFPVISGPGAAAGMYEGGGASVSVMAAPPPAEVVPTPAVPLPPPTVSKYCRLHSTPEQRVKAEPSLRECACCRIVLQTNFAQFAVCPPCSDKEGLCVICGSEALGVVPRAAHLAPAPPPAPLPPQPQAGRCVYCNRHSHPENRARGNPTIRECSTCHVRFQTNFADVALCPGCSGKEQRCMICGVWTAVRGAPEKTYPHDNHGVSASLQPRGQSPTRPTVVRRSMSPIPPPAPARVGTQPGGPQGIRPVVRPTVNPLVSAVQPAPLPTAAAHPPGPQPPKRCQPKFCVAHCTTDRRCKGETKIMDCKSCRVPMQTNYAEFALCPTCSDKDCRCMVCGALAGTAAPESREATMRSNDPSQHPVQQPMQQAVQQPMQQPVQQPAQQPMQQPVQQPAQQFAQQPPQQPAQQPAQQLPVPAVSGAPSAGPRYCHGHSLPERRPKGPHRLGECTACHGRFHTNHLDFSLCLSCADREQRCVICAAVVPSVAAAPTPSASVACHVHSMCISVDTVLGPSGSVCIAPESLPSGPMGSVCFAPENFDNVPPPLPEAAVPFGNVPPRYCSMHCAAEKRLKAEPRLRQCESCHRAVETNYVDFSLCPPCADREGRCMICTANALIAGPASLQYRMPRRSW